MKAQCRVVQERRQASTRRVVDGINRAADVEQNTSKQPLQQLSPQEDEDQELEGGTEEAACWLPRAVEHGLNALERAEVERLIKKEKTGVPQPFPERIEFPLPLKAGADLRKRVDEQLRTQRRGSNAQDGENQGCAPRRS